MAEDTKNNENRPKKRKIIIPVAIVAAILAGCYLISESRFQSTDDAYVEADIIQVTPKVSGHIVESYIEYNKEVKIGLVYFFEGGRKCLIETYQIFLDFCLLI